MLLVVVGSRVLVEVVGSKERLLQGQGEQSDEHAGVPPSIILVLCHTCFTAFAIDNQCLLSSVSCTALPAPFVDISAAANADGNWHSAAF